MKYRLTSRLIRLIPMMGLMCIACWTGGCASEPASQQLTLRSVRQGQTFTQQFSRAYICRENDGDTDIVLADQAAEHAVAGHKMDSPVKQIMHIRVMWNPNRDQKSDHSSASNATVHWYVMGNTTQSASDVLEYAGTAMVAVDDPEQPTEFTIREAAIEPVACRGELCDPVGVSTFTGTVHATPSNKRVRDLLSSVRTVVAASNSVPNRVLSARPESASSLAR